MNTDQLLLIKTRHDGEQPAGWAKGDDEFQRAKVIAAFAWAAVKADDEPLLQHCDITHQENCTAVVESLMRGNVPDNLPFALKAAEILRQLKERQDGHNQNTD